MYSKCNYIFKKGKNKGFTCNNKVLFNFKCKQHLKPYYLKWLEDKTKNPFTLKNIKQNTLKFMDNIYYPSLKKNNSMFLEKNYIRYSKFKIKIPKVINNNWILGKRLGEGGFGIVYECFSENNKCKKSFAIKMEHEKSFSLYNEIKFYNAMRNNKYIPKLYDFGVYRNIRYIVIEKLFKWKFSNDKIYDIIEALQSFSHYNKSHGDVKMENIMKRKNGELVFIDFGLSKSLRKNIERSSISGTLCYMSINAHLGIVNKINDIESLLYCLLEKIHKLPWNNCNFNLNNIQYVVAEKMHFIDSIKNKNKKILVDFKLNENNKLYTFAKYIINKDNNINYKYIKNIFIQGQ